MRAVAEPIIGRKIVRDEGHSASVVPLLRAQNVHRILGSGEAAAHILRGVSLTVSRREYVSVVGASGSGKSTLLYLLGGWIDRAGWGRRGGSSSRPARCSLMGRTRRS